MKWNKLAILNGMIAVALWISMGRAAGQYYVQPLNFKLTVLQQQPIILEATRSTNDYGFSSVLPARHTSDINKSKLNSQGLLSLLASAMDTNWPAGATLALDKWSGNIFIVDATGTNPVCNVSDGRNLGDTNVVFFRCGYDLPVAKGHAWIQPRPGGGLKYSTEGSHFGMVFFHLFIERDGLTNTDLSFAGLDVANYHSHFIQSSNTVPTSANSFSRTKETIPVMGDGMLEETWSVVQGTVTSLLVTEGGPAAGVPISPPPPRLPPPTVLPPPPPNWFTNVFTNIVVPPPILLTNAP